MITLCNRLDLEETPGFRSIVPKISISLDTARQLPGRKEAEASPRIVIECHQFILFVLLINLLIVNWSVTSTKCKTSHHSPFLVIFVGHYTFTTVAEFVTSRVIFHLSFNHL